MLDQFVEMCHSSLYFISDRIRNKKVKQNLRIARISYSLSEYFSAVIVSCTFISVFIAVLFIKVELFPLCFFLCFALSLQIPKILAQKYQNEIENELLKELHTIILELKMQIDFENIILKRRNRTNLGKEFSVIFSEINHGKTVQNTLKEFSDSFDSEFINQAAAQLILIYEKGNQNTESLEKIVNAKNRENLIKLKEKNQKQGYYSILFVTSSTVLPAMFQAYFIISSSFLSLDYSSMIWPAMFVFLMINFILMVRMYAG